jgi:hypothetical protein
MSSWRSADRGRLVLAQDAVEKEIRFGPHRLAQRLVEVGEEAVRLLGLMSRTKSHCSAKLDERRQFVARHARTCVEHRRRCSWPCAATFSN